MISRRLFLGRALAAIAVIPAILRPRRKLGVATQLTCVKPFQPGFRMVPIDAINIDSAINARNQSVSDPYFAGLVKSINEQGLMTPIVISPTGRLCDGYRRVIACRHLQHTQIVALVLTWDQYIQWKNFMFATCWGSSINPCGEIPLI